MHKFKVRDTVLLSGWLFSDLLLGLAIIFLVSLPGAQAARPLILKWTATPRSLAPNSPQCTGGPTAPNCKIILTETGDSQGSMNWEASSDMGNTVVFSPANGILSPGKSVTVALSAFPCQNGSFTFTSPQVSKPVTIIWNCRPTQERLNFNYKEFGVIVHDVNGLLNNSQSAITDVEKQVKQQSFLQHGSAGLAIVYGGAPDVNGIDQAQQIANKVYGILAMLGQQGFAFQRSSYYVPLFILGADASQVKVDIYLFQTVAG